MFVFGDVAGQYDTLLKLLEKAGNPKDFICLGDPNDRGPNSKEVIEFLKNNGKTVQSNHAHILIDAYNSSKFGKSYKNYYQKGICFYKGGVSTLSSYNTNWEKLINFKLELKDTRYFQEEVHFDESKFKDLIPEDHMNFLGSCPLFIKDNKYVYTHAPIAADKRDFKDLYELGDGFTEVIGVDYKSDSSVLWNRRVPDSFKNSFKSTTGLINIFGHNSSSSIKVYCESYPSGKKVNTSEELQALCNNDNVWGICLDTSSVKKLTGIDLDTMTIYEQDYI